MASRPARVSSSSFLVALSSASFFSSSASSLSLSLVRELDLRSNSSALVSSSVSLAFWLATFSSAVSRSASSREILFLRERISLSCWRMRSSLSFDFFSAASARSKATSASTRELFHLFLELVHRDPGRKNQKKEEIRKVNSKWNQEKKKEKS